MKSLRKKMLAMAAVVAVSGLMMASVAGAVDKLLVKDAAGTNNVFTVDDAGVVTGKKIGVGTSTPQSPIHLNLTTDPVGHYCSLCVHRPCSISSAGGVG